MPSVAETGLALDQLGAEPFLNVETAALFASQSFTDTLFSCKQGDGINAAISEGQCVWLQPRGRFFDSNTTSNNIGFNENTGGLSAGAQFALDTNWSLGFGLSYEEGSLETTNGANADVDRYQVGAVVKYQADAFLFAAALSSGVSRNDLTRRITFGGLNLTPTSSPDVSFVSAQVRAAYLIKNGDWSFRPTLDFNVTSLDSDSVTETGGGAANLTVQGGRETYFSISPSAEISHDIKFDNGSKLRAFADLGITYFASNTHSLGASFASAPVGVGAFTASSEFDQLLWDIEIGATLFSKSGNSLTARYQSQFSSNTKSNRAELRASFKF